MTAKLRSLWVSINASYWFYPALFSLLAAVLAFVTIGLDRLGGAAFLTEAGWLVPARPEGARTLLSVIAGSMIGVAATVFSITIAAVAYASGNYGPRLLTNFMEDRPNQLSLGVFISVFVYALLVLRVVRDTVEPGAGERGVSDLPLHEFTPQLSLLTASLLALVAVGTLVFFLNHIPSSIRINSVLHGIGTRLIEDIGQRFPHDSAPQPAPEPERGNAITANQPGFIKIVDFGSLDRLAEACGATLFLKVRTGDFVHPDVVLLEVVGRHPDRAMIDDLRQCFSISSLRTPVQDLEFLFDELVEIALRALSPGINDPFTAITALQWIGAATAELGGRRLDQGPEAAAYSRRRVVPLDDDFAHFVARGFGAARASAASNPLAAHQFIDCLDRAATTCHAPDRRTLLRSEAERLMTQARLDLRGPTLKELETRHAKFTARMKELGA